MPKVCVLQSDNRPSLEYLLKSKAVNTMFCNCLGYDYIFLQMDDSKSHMDPRTKKIFIVNNFLQQSTEYDILIFLDSDAWIQNGHFLNIIINNLMNDENKNGCFSRDISVIHHTFINSGAFILKINDFVREMYRNLETEVYQNITYHNLWPHDQYYISKYVFENKEQFMIFSVEIMNTPVGIVLRHNWAKDIRMYDDLNKLLTLDENNLMNYSIKFDVQKHYDDTIFPNVNNDGYNYFNV
jgi:uncharacterized protein YueI